MDYVLILLIHPEREKKYLRIGVASLFGALFTLAVLYYWCGKLILFYFLRFFCVLLMCVVAIPSNGLGELLCNTFLLYGLGGSACGIYSLISVSYECFGSSDAVVVIITFGLFIGIKQLLRFRKKAKYHFSYLTEVCLKKDDVTIRKKAFYDTGNHLYEPISGKTVILIRDKLVDKLQLRIDTFRVVPYSSLGNESGLLKAYKLDELIVGTGENRKKYKDIYVAVAEKSLFRLEGCDVILHSEHM